MKVLAVCGSPRKGNTEWMLNKLLEQLEKKGAETELLLLRKLNVKRCLGCLTCEGDGGERPGVCAVKDDMQGIYPKLLAADVIVLGTPVYFYMLSGLLKNFIDRTCPIWTKLEGKGLAGVVVAEEGLGQAVSNLKGYADCCGLEWVGSVTALAKNPGEAARDKSVERRLARLALRIISHEKEQRDK
jgi:multimeric flavodoxin WrbA